MIHLHTTLRSALCGGLMLLAAGVCRADDTPPKPDANLDIIQYKMPTGWQASDQAGERLTRIYVAPDSNAAGQAMILIILYPVKEGLDLAAEFDAAVKTVTSDGKVLEPGTVAASNTRQGFEALSRTLVKENPGGQRVYARMTGAKVRNRMAGIYYLATTQKIYDLHQADMDALLKSVNFNVGAGAPANASAAKAEIDALEKQKQELLRKVAEIEARQRQLAGGDAGAAPVGVAVGGDDQLLRNAKERFAKEVGGRRKPHTILGDILGYDGKPIPDVENYTVVVWGITIAAERARYGLEVDAKGHFEQQVPDGLYQISATCIVKNNGHRVPVDLVWLDDRKVGTDEASTGGIVKDYRLAMGGLKPGENPNDLHSYYGGRLMVTGPAHDLTRGSFAARHPGGMVQLTLTPLGALIDGSRREAFTVDIPTADLNYNKELGKIPIGAYRVTAALVEKGGAKRAMTCARTFGVETAGSLDIFWECREHQEDRADPAVYLKD